MNIKIGSKTNRKERGERKEKKKKLKLTNMGLP